jgi:metallo-beta-lactamase class B
MPLNWKFAIAAVSLVAVGNAAVGAALTSTLPGNPGEAVAWTEACADMDEWDKPGPPYRIYGNSYYVGTCGISAILVTGTEGHVLIDGGTEKGADLIAANIERLGFTLSDVKILLHSHEHHDHVGGISRLQQLTGARLLASSAAAPVLATGKASSDDPQLGVSKPFPSARVDGRVMPGRKVRLGSIALTPVATPGHTPGALTWQWRACDGDDCHTLVYADSLSPISSDHYRFSDHPAYLAAFRAGLARLSALDCDILMTPHPSASGMRDRLLKGTLSGDRNGCKTYAAAIGEKLDARLAKEVAR